MNNMMLSSRPGMFKPPVGDPTTYRNWFIDVPPDGTRNDADFTVGGLIRLFRDRAITKIGRKYPAGNVQDHPVYMWTDTGTPVIAETILAASPSDTDGFKWATLAAPLSLSAGYYMIAADEFAGGDFWTSTAFPAVSGTALSLDPVFEIIESRYRTGNGSFPTSGAGSLDGLLHDTVALSYANPATAASASFIGADTTTRGAWIGTYGTDGYWIAPSGSVGAKYAGYAASSSFCQLGSIIGNSYFTWDPNSSDAGALQKPDDPTHGFASTWYTSGTEDFLVFADNARSVGMYFFDYGPTGRSATVEVLDALTGASLDGPRTVSGTPYANGVYLRWTISGSVRIRVSYGGTGFNATVSGIFFD